MSTSNLAIRSDKVFGGTAEPWLRMQVNYDLAQIRKRAVVSPKNAFIGVGLFFENRQEARKLGLLPPGKSFEAVCERPEPQERKERVFKGQPDIDDFNCIIWVSAVTRLTPKAA
jgi:hypothetical protein